MTHVDICIGFLQLAVYSPVMSSFNRSLQMIAIISLTENLGWSFDFSFLQSVAYGMLH